MNKKIASLAGFVASLGLTAGANAGYNWSPTVTVSTGVFIDVAHGSLGAARNAPDANQYIGCSNSGSSATCYASNAAGVAISCSTNVASHLAALQSLNGDSFLLFHVDLSTGKCSAVHVRNSSYLAPK
jgi:hypothetical protein